MDTAYRNRFVNVKRALEYRYAGWQFGLLLAGLLAALSVAAAERFGSGLLWKLELAGTPASYLFGTMHSDDPRVLELPLPVRQAFDQAQGLVLELELDAGSIAFLSSSLLLGDGKSLATMIDGDLYRRTVTAMAEQGLPETMVARMKPWAVAVTLMTPPVQSGVVLDQLLYQQAVAAGKTVQGLETVAEQVGLFDSLSEQEQIGLLRDTVDHLPEITQMLEDIQAAWLAGDLQRLVELNEAAMQDADPSLARQLNERVIVERNHRMAERMQAALRLGNRFIAVGALHLPGEQGLLMLLSGRGYRVTRIY